MQTHNHPVNAFAQMGDPDAIKNALEHAAKWTLKSRMCHPLDRPVRNQKKIGHEQAAFDAAADAMALDE